MYKAGTWDLSVGKVIKDKFKWSVVLVPRGPKGNRGAMFGQDYMSIPRPRRSRPEAWQVVKALCDRRTGILLGLGGTPGGGNSGTAGGRPDVYESEELRNNPDYTPEVHAARVRSLKETTLINFPANHRIAEMLSVVTNAMEQMWSGTKPDKAWADTREREHAGGARQAGLGSVAGPEVSSRRVAGSAARPNVPPLDWCPRSVRSRPDVARPAARRRNAIAGATPWLTRRRARAESGRRSGRPSAVRGPVGLGVDLALAHRLPRLHRGADARLALPQHDELRPDLTADAGSASRTTGRRSRERTASSGRRLGGRPCSSRSWCRSASPVRWPWRSW